MPRRNQPTASLTPAEAAALFAAPHLADRFPPLLTVDQVADLFQVPKQTVYAWSSQGRLDGCARRAGRHLRVNRDRLIQLYSEGKLYGNGS